jgi:hypothetical protein
VWRFIAVGPAVCPVETHKECEIRNKRGPKTATHDWRKSNLKQKRCFLIELHWSQKSHHRCRFQTSGHTEASQIVLSSGPDGGSLFIRQSVHKWDDRVHTKTRSMQRRAPSFYRWRRPMHSSERPCRQSWHGESWTPKWMPPIHLKIHKKITLRYRPMLHPFPLGH